MSLSPNFYTPEQCLAHYGIARSIGGITIHHWGDPATNPTFDSVVAHLCNPKAYVSAHYVVEDGRREQLVDDANAAWHAGNRVGNARTIGLELNPLERDGDYQEAAQLIAELRARYGDLPLYPHNHWFNTACPGTYDLGRLDSLARGITPVDSPVLSGPAPIPAPAPKVGYAMDRLDLRNAQNVRVTGRHVDNLQGLLLAAGYGPTGLVGSNGRPDGVAGPATKNAVGDWQRRTNTGDGKGNADFIVGDGTWKSLIEY